MKFFLFTSIALGLTTSASFAQDLTQSVTDEEMMNRIQLQLEEALGPSRGLGLVTDTNAEATDTTGDSFKNLSEIKTDTGTIVTSPVTVPESLQINIRIQFEFDAICEFHGTVCPEIPSPR